MPMVTTDETRQDLARQNAKEIVNVIAEGLIAQGVHPAFAQTKAVAVLADYAETQRQINQAKRESFKFGNLITFPKGKS